MCWWAVEGGEREKKKKKKREREREERQGEKERIFRAMDLQLQISGSLRMRLRVRSRLSSSWVSAIVLFDNLLTVVEKVFFVAPIFLSSEENNDSMKTPPSELFRFIFSREEPEPETGMSRNSSSNSSTMAAIGAHFVPMSWGTHTSRN